MHAETPVATHSAPPLGHFSHKHSPAPDQAPGAHAPPGSPFASCLVRSMPEVVYSVFNQSSKGKHAFHRISCEGISYIHRKTLR
jgi:hypothetical protein